MAAVDLLATATPFGLGPCQVEYDCDNPTGKVVIDRTKGGCHFKYQISTEDITMDQTGDSPQDVLLTGAKIVVEVPMATDELELIARVTPGSTVYTNATTSEKSVEFTTSAGTSLLTLAKPLRIVPLNAPNDMTKVIYVFKAIAVPNWDVVYDPKNPHLRMVQFVGVVDPTKRNRTFAMGDIANLPA